MGGMSEGRTKTMSPYETNRTTFFVSFYSSCVKMGFHEAGDQYLTIVNLNVHRDLINLDTDF